MGNMAASSFIYILVEDPQRKENFERGRENRKLKKQLRKEHEKFQEATSKVVEYKNKGKRPTTLS